MLFITGVVFTSDHVFDQDLSFIYGSGRLLKQRFRNPFRLRTQLRHSDGLPKCSAQQWTKSKQQAGSLAVMHAVDPSRRIEQIMVVVYQWL